MDDGWMETLVELSVTEHCEKHTARRLVVGLCGEIRIVEAKRTLVSLARCSSYAGLKPAVTTVLTCLHAAKHE